MGKPISRRRFLQWAPALGMSLYGLERFGARPVFGSTEAASPPIFVTNYDYPQIGNIAGPMLMRGEHALDAITKGVNVVEEDRSLIYVGAGGLTTSEGIVELDALVMSGPDHNAGAVGALRNIDTPISVARKVMEETPHVLLVDEGALKFAKSQGFEEEDLLAKRAKRADGGNKGIHEFGDTIGVIALDRNRDLWVGVSTSGYPQGKMPGRVGDSALIGAGGYVDNEIGGAVSWGPGEIVIRFACTYQIVENMRKGMSPAQACNEVLNRIRAKGVAWGGGLTALNKQGEFGAVGMPGPFAYRVFADGQNFRKEAYGSWRSTPKRSRIFMGGAVASEMEARSASRPAFQARRATQLPIAVTSWFPQVSQAVGARLMEGAPALDAIEYGINLIERDRSEGSVGAGNNPNREGVVELDAAVMSGPDHNAGSVAALQHIDTPVSVARKVMEETRHDLLVGEGALKFALAQGFPYQESLRPKIVGKSAGVPPEYHDTVGVIVLDENRDLYVGMSTSGTSNKMPGRVGDSPLIGAGSYVDNEVGGATATGVGEQVIKFAGSYQVVENMRHRMSPGEACNEVLNRMVRKGHTKWVAFTALNKAGEFAAVGMSRFSYHVFSGEASREFRSDVITPITAAPQVDNESALPKGHKLFQNTPNPFNTRTQITYMLAEDGRVSLRVYNSRGRLVRTLVDGRKAAGYYNVRWDGTGKRGKTMPSGVYFYQLKTEEFTSSKRMVLIR